MHYTKRNNKKCYQNLPQEIIYQIISFIDTIAIEKSFQIVSKEFHSICEYVRTQRPKVLRATEFEAVKQKFFHIKKHSNTMISHPAIDDWFATIYKRGMKQGKNYRFKVRLDKIYPTHNEYKIAIGVVTSDHYLSGDRGFLRKNKAFCILMNGQKCCGTFTAKPYYYIDGLREKRVLKDGTVITVIVQDGSLYFELDGVSVGLAYELPKVDLYPAIFFYGSHHVVTLV
jgi:hypothetical protein